MLKALKIIFLISVCCFFINAIFNDKLVIKHIGTDDISLKWYYYSYITNDSPEFVVVKKGGRKKEIFKGVRTITDVSVQNHTIVIRLYQPGKSRIDPEKIIDSVFGYSIAIDSSATVDDLRNVPDAKKENVWGLIW